MSKLTRRKTWSQEKFTDDADVIWWVHKREVCEGTYCAIHNPSEHPLKDAPIVLRHASPFSFKPHGFVERMCEHGIGHSDPDSVAFYTRNGNKGHGMHGCDGCCWNDNPVYDEFGYVLCACDGQTLLQVHVERGKGLCHDVDEKPRDNKGWGPHEHSFEYFDDENGHSGSFCSCGEEEP